MTRTLNLLRSLLRSVAAPAAALALMLMIAGSTAQTPPPNPTVDLSVGPVATSTEAVNVALALSVEFPTVGSPYKLRAYDHSQTFLGYWDATGCYPMRTLRAGRKAYEAWKAKGREDLLR